MPVGEEVDDRLEQLGRYLADRAELIDRAERNRSGADELLRPFGELEQLDPGGDARPRPSERLGGAVLGQPAIGEHRAYGLGLLVWVELLTGDVLDRPVGVLAVDVADLGVDVGLAELLVRGNSVIARDELVVVTGDSHDHRHNQPTQLDRGRERVDVVGVEFADVVTDRDAVQRDPLPAAIHECGHLTLLWLVAPPGAGPIPDLHARLRATLGRGRLRARRYRSVLPVPRATAGARTEVGVLVPRGGDCLGVGGRAGVAVRARTLAGGDLQGVQALGLDDR